MNDKPLDYFSRRASKNELEDWRKRIDALDEKILTLLAKRMNIANRIGKIKKDQKISALDKNRWEQVLKSNLKKGEKLGLSQEFLNNLLNLIHRYSLEVQKKS